MSNQPPAGSRRIAPYGSAKDLPSYHELRQQIQSAKLLTLFIARDQRKNVLDADQQLERLTRVVDDFYSRLGPRNWIFHDMLNVAEVEQLLAETSDAESAEERLIDMYRDEDTTKWWRTRLRAHSGLRARLSQIERAGEHYDAGRFDSCVLHLITVMDGFVNDFEPGVRRGLHSRDPDDMTAWDSVVGHHMGLTHALRTFNKTIKKRIDDEVFEVYRHGIVHGSVVTFDNVVVATKAWNMLYALADWAAATTKAAQPKKHEPSWGETWSALTRRAAYKKYQRAFKPSTLKPSDPRFSANEVVALASRFLDAWEHGRWGIVAEFAPPILRGPESDGQAARHAKDVFGASGLTDWTISSLTYDQASTAQIEAQVTVNGGSTEMRFRMVFWTHDGNVGVPGQDEGKWSLAVWAPHTYFQGTA